jgi:hypothetical protein
VLGRVHVAAEDDRRPLGQHVLLEERRHLIVSVAPPADPQRMDVEDGDRARGSAEDQLLGLALVLHGPRDPERPSADDRLLDGGFVRRVNGAPAVQRADEPLDPVEHGRWNLLEQDEVGRALQQHARDLRLIAVLGPGVVAHHRERQREGRRDGDVPLEQRDVSDRDHRRGEPEEC